MSRNSQKSSAHALLKFTVVIFLVAFTLEAYLQNEFSFVYTLIFGATLIAAVLIIFLINYNDFQRYAFIPVILISLNEIYQRLSSGTDVVETLYYLAFILISIYFIVRSQKKKAKTKNNTL